jgi:predicted Zn-dependent protease
MNSHDPLLGERYIRHLLHQALALSEADETEIVFSTYTEALTRFAHNVIHQNVAEVDAQVEVRAALGKRIGLATTNDISVLGLECAVRRASELARHLPENPEWPGLPEPQTPSSAPLAYDVRVAESAPETRGHAVAEICRAAQGAELFASGAFSVEHGESAVANSQGLFTYAPHTVADLNFVVEQPEFEASVYAQATGWRMEQINFAALTDQALALARAARRPQTLPPGEYPVVLDSYAVLTLLEALAADGMGALAVQEDRSWMNRRFGTPTFSPRLSIYDDAFDPDGLPQAFDCEGVPKQRVPIVVNGVPTSPVYDRLTASRERGKVSTGHAQPYAAEDWDGPLPENLSLTPGDLTVPELIATLPRGLYVSRLWYVNLTTPHAGGVTGTTRDGVWWIENGELAYPVANLRFDQSLIEALSAANVRGVGRERATLSGLYGTHRVPALALASFRFIDVHSVE